MGSLTVLAFDDVAGAEAVRDRLFYLQRRELRTIEDAAVVVRDETGRTRVEQAASLVGVRALGEAFCGLFIDLLSLAPWLGLVAGATSGTIVGKLSDSDFEILQTNLSPADETSRNLRRGGRRWMKADA